MAKIDLEKYKAAWKKEQAFEGEILSESEIGSFMRSASRNILVLFKRSLVFDLFFKGVLLVLLVVLAFLMPYSAGWMWFCLSVALLLAGGIVWQVYTIRRVPYLDQGELSILDLIRQYIAFYYRHYYHSMFVGAFSSVLLFLIGSLYYYFFKYREIPALQIDDLLVLGAGLVLNFAFSAIAQVKQGNFRIKQLEERVKEIEEHTFSAHSLNKYRNVMLRNYSLIGIGLIAGLLLLLYFIYSLTS